LEFTNEAVGSRSFKKVSRRILPGPICAFTAVELCSSYTVSGKRTPARLATC